MTFIVNYLIPDKPARLDQLEAHEIQLTRHMRFQSAFRSLEREIRGDEKSNDKLHVY